MKVLKGLAWAVTLAVSVWFYAESRNAVARYNALSEPAVAAAPAPVTAPPAAVPAPTPADAQAQTARIQAEMAKLAIPGPGEALLPKAPGQLIVDFSPQAAANGDIDYKAVQADKRLNCAAFSFVPDPRTGKRVNRIFCEQKGG